MSDNNPAKTLEMFLTGKWLDAEEALKNKLVNRVVTRAELWPAADRLAHKILSYNYSVVARAKQAVKEGIELPLVEGLELERADMAQLFVPKKGTAL